ncbi:hypothetical protein P7K49_002893 [Saguinus oedipus]|uniref:Uncharacterized protein n=1 Tax=Saguinus oedipus TaxID=9490 RepID=A0ABQ9WMM7_SAGOE|nr:hypothetical protein P7K49_002893 [Saguinus oedipus]
MLPENHCELKRSQYGLSSGGLAHCAGVAPERLEPDLLEFAPGRRTHFQKDSGTFGDNQSRVSEEGEAGQAEELGREHRPCPLACIFSDCRVGASSRTHLEPPNTPAPSAHYPPTAQEGWARSSPAPPRSPALEISPPHLPPTHPRL